MKHFLVILFLIICGYAAYAVTDPDERRRALRLIAHHGFRVGALMLAAFLLLAAAVYLPASSIL